MIYDASDILDRMSAKNKLETLIKGNKRFELKEKRERKSISQNGYMHLILGWAAINFGYTTEEMKQYIFKAEVSPDIFYQGEAGTIIKINRWRSWEDLDQQERNDAINRFKKYIMEKGLYLPEPKDLALLQEIEKQVNNFNERKNK